MWAAVCAALTIGVSGLAHAADKTTLVVMIRGLDNPYHADYAAGAKALGKALDLPVDVLSSEGNSQKQFSDLKAEIAKTGGNMVVNVDPNEGPDVVPIAKMLESAGVYWVSWWNKPDDIKVEDYPHWVAHISFDAVGQGYFNAKELFKTFKTPNQGTIIAIQGMLSNNAAIDRFKGLQKALKEYPNVKLVQWEAADWDTNKSYEITKQLLSAHPDVDGVWSANDNMALGSIAALKEVGKSGQVKVSGTDGIPDAFDAIKEGTMSSTAYDDARYQAQLGLSMALAAKSGKLDVKATPHKYRAFLIPGAQVTPQNVDQIKAGVGTMPTYDLKNFYARWVAEIK
ncbi:sugar ABC transporter substrate-binding protein [Pararobbsia silviterrae]|uniref:Sugar ABC transporter substrate-binding protein n=2 Tax=Pararobbsia silviterrae TaxID=1792498 RepID=A0A494XDQ4_9BURK|nr:sugar ABC transporter substrate-binding protein [Pararobbsia silviterrae]